MSNKQILARSLLTETPDSIKKKLPKTVDVIYDDGKIVESRRKKLIYSWFIWEFHRRYPQLELTYDHHVDSVLNGGSLSSNTHIELLERITKQLVLDHHLESDQERDHLLETIYFITNQLHNWLPILSSQYVATLDIEDILELANDPEIIRMKREMKPTASSITDFYAKSYKVITESPQYADNNLLRFIKMKILNQNQVNQCILARGFPIEVTGTILSTAILSCYATGMYKLYDFIADSRGAAKHLFSAEAPLQDTEYFARRLQLVNMAVKGIVKRDCGSQKYLNWLVKPPTYTSYGRMEYQGDLRYMKGKRYLDPETNTLKTITGKETHLYGRTIKLRSVLFCQEPDPHMVCKVCFGELHHNVSPHANLGHLCSATVTQQLTQSILGTKHLIGSAVGTDIQLKEDAQRYMAFSYTGMAYYMKPFNPTSKYRMIVNRNAAIGLTDLKLLGPDVAINPRRISSISDITIQEERPDGMVISIPITIEQNNRYGYFSLEFLKYLRTKGWTTNEYDHFVFDITDWNTKQRIIHVPDMEYSYSDHAVQIANMIESNTKKMNQRSENDTPETLLQSLFDLVNSKINVNVALLEVMVYANMTPSNDNYGMARNVEGAGMNVSRFITMNRSLGAAYAYQSQHDIIANPRSFFQENRPDSPIDVYMTPREVVTEIYRQKQQ